MTIDKEKNDKPIRCSKCVLPASVPNIQFDSNGQCIWCQKNYPNYQPLGKDKLQEKLDRHRKSDGSPDCLVAVSGGKDSAYALYELKCTFGMNVEAFTYIHDGLTEFALENAKSVCNTIGVKHHLVSLANQKHLHSFRSFFRAWVDFEASIAANMACVACKHLHIMGTQLAKKRNIPFIVWSACLLEEPPFILTLSSEKKKSQFRKMMTLASILAAKIITMPKLRNAFLNNFSTCFFGCLAYRPSSGYLQRLYPSVHHINFFEYCNWDGNEIISTLKTNSNWSLPESIVSDWHSDCLFNVYKEYMFQKMIGASYTDAFLSNLIRHGKITREQAWEKLCKSKEYYAKETINLLSILGLEDVKANIDISCFNI